MTKPMKPITRTQDREMLAADLADMLDRYGYDLGVGVGNVSENDIAPLLPAFLAGVAANARASATIPEGE